MLKNKDKTTLVGVAVYGLFLLGYLFCSFTGFISQESPWETLFVVAAFTAMIIILCNREHIEKRIEPYLIYAKPLVCLMLVFISFYLLERSYNQRVFDISFGFALPNLFIIGALFAIVYFAGNQSKTAAICFLCLCFIAGVANYFVIQFKGQPILPSDIFALETAAAVGDRYHYLIDSNVVKSYTMLAFGILLVVFLPKTKVDLKHGLANTGLALVCFIGFGTWYSNSDIGKAYGCEVDVWSSKESYAQQGSLLCFIKRAQDLSPTAPEGYSLTKVAEILASYSGDHSLEADTSALASDNAKDTPVSDSLYTGADTSDMPTVIVVMNETFADFSEYEVLSENYAGPHYYRSIDDATIKGQAYVSALAGGTCNSEFEFLTGSSMASLGGGVYPYVLYDLDGTENLASYFKSFGYETTAIHPAESVNWRRSQVYSQLGFDTFYDIHSFEDAQTLRDLPTDRETYDLILEQLAENDSPQFIFDVTIQNHGGYETGAIPDELLIDAPIDGVSYPELNEYLSCIQQSDEDLAYLIENLEALNRPVVLCFFGDHEPELADWLASLEFKKDITDFELEEVQERYKVPFMIWRNYDKETGIENGSTSNMTSSLNYLGSLLIQETGLPLTPYHRFLLSIRPQLPALNLNGYMNEEGVWHWIGEESDVSHIYDDYALVEYSNLFETMRASL